MSTNHDNRKKVWLLTALVAAQVLFLVGWAGWHESLRRGGEVVRLETRPVDPRDILRGDYMILNYAISRHQAPAWLRGVQRVVVVLRDEGGFGVIDEVREVPPERGDGRPWMWALATRRHGGMMTLDYGIERYFVPEGMGEPRFERMEVDVAVSRSGRVRIVQVWLDGEPYP